MYLLTKSTQSSKLLIKLAFQRLLGYHITQKIHLKDKEKNAVNLWQQSKEERMKSQVKPQDAFVKSGTIPKGELGDWVNAEGNIYTVNNETQVTEMPWQVKTLAAKTHLSLIPRAHITQNWLLKVIFWPLRIWYTNFFLKSFNRRRLTDGGGVQITS